MFTDGISKLADAGATKARYLAENPVGFWISSMMAGVYVGFGILLIFSIGSVLDPSVRPLAMGATFGVALILVVFAGADLYTGLTMSMPLAVFECRSTWDGLGRVWATSWLGNFAGALLLAGLFVLGGGGIITTASSELIYKAAAAKMNMDALPLLARAILCNWLGGVQNFSHFHSCDGFGFRKLLLIQWPHIHVAFSGPRRSGDVP